MADDFLLTGVLAIHIPDYRDMDWNGSLTVRTTVQLDEASVSLVSIPVQHGHENGAKRLLNCVHPVVGYHVICRSNTMILTTATWCPSHVSGRVGCITTRIDMTSFHIQQ